MELEVVNVNKHVLKWAKLIHGITEEPLEGNRGQTTRVEVEWGRVKVEVVGQENKSVTGEDIQQNQAATDQASQESAGVVFKSVYKNNSDVAQQHQFTMSRETSAIVSTSVTKGFSRSDHVGIKLAVPDVVSNVTGGFGPEIEVTEEEQRRVSHSLKWTVNSTVNVPSKQTTVATLVVKEVDKSFTFKAKAILRGTILVRVLDLTSGRFLKVVQNDIATLLKDIRDKQKNVSNQDYNSLAAIPGDVNFNPSDTHKPGSVEWPIEGKLNFRFGIDQNVTVEPQA